MPEFGAKRDKLYYIMTGRITRPYALLSSIFEELESDRVIVYEHEADEEVSRTHIHFLIDGCEVQILSLKNRIRKVLKEIDRSDWSFKTGGTKEFITYMSKGKLEPKYVRGYDNLDYTIEELKAKWIDFKKQSIQTKLLSKNNNKKTYQDIVDKVIKTVSRSGKQIETINRTTVDLVTMILLQELNEHKILTGRFKIRDMLDTIFREVAEEDFRARITSTYLERFSKETF